MPRYQTGRCKIAVYLIFSPTDSAVAAAAAAVSSALGVAARARIFLEPSTRGRAAGAHIRAYPTNDDAIQSPGMPGLHGPDTINVLRSTSDTAGRTGNPEGEG